MTSPTREHRVKYRRPHGTEWEDLDLDRAMDMIADRVIATRAQTWEEHDAARAARCAARAASQASAARRSTTRRTT